MGELTEAKKTFFSSSVEVDVLSLCGERDANDDIGVDNPKGFRCNPHGVHNSVVSV